MYLKDLLHIGCAAEALELHATRLAIRGHDSAGAGSATEVDEEELTEEERANREAAEGNDDLDGEEDGSRRANRQQQAYDEIKSDRDKLKNDLDAQRRENQEFKERLTKIEGEKSAREKTNEQTNAHLSLAKQRSREIVSEINKLDANDPERAAKVYDTILERVYEDLPKFAEEISERKARETFQRERKLDKDQDEAKRVTLEALDRAGMGEEWFEEVEDLAIRMDRKNPSWFKETPVDDQIDELVGMVKKKWIKTKRSSQEFQDEKDRHHTPMRGVIDRGSQRRSVRDQDEEEPRTNPGSILADMAKAKTAKVLNSNRMVRQADSQR